MYIYFIMISKFFQYTSEPLKQWIAKPFHLRLRV